MGGALWASFCEEWNTGHRGLGAPQWHHSAWLRLQERRAIVAWVSMGAALFAEPLCALMLLVSGPPWGVSWPPCSDPPPGPSYVVNRGFGGVQSFLGLWLRCLPPA